MYCMKLLMAVFKHKYNIREYALQNLIILYHKIMGSSEEDEVSGFFVLSHLWMGGYFRLG